MKVTSKVRGMTQFQLDALAADELRASEDLVPSFCSDVAGCGCETHTFAGIPCTTIGRDRETGDERCLLCWLTWKERKYRCDPLVIIDRGPPSRRALARRRAA